MDADLIESLAARAALSDLLADYAAAIDWFDFGAMEHSFWPDSRFDYGLFQGGFEAFRDWVVDFESQYERRLHMFGLPVIRIDGDTARIDVTSVILCRKDGSDEYFWGRYLFTAARREGIWRFSGITYVINLLSRAPATTGDDAIPLHWADDLRADHPLSQRGTVRHAPA